MSARSFEDTWQRAKIKRAQLSGLRASQPLPLEPCPLDPTRPNLHPAQLLERDLLTLTDEQFNQLAPDHARQLESDQPAQTGVAWIDELERELYKER